MSADVQEVLNGAIPLNILENPYWEVVIDAKDHSNIHKTKIKAMDRTAAVYTTTYNSYTLQGLRTSSSASSVDFTETWNCTESGYYCVKLRIRKHPDDTGFISLYDGSTLIGNPISAHHDWEHIRTVTYPIRWYNSGNHSLKITVTKQAFVESIKIEKVNRFIGNSDKLTVPGAEQLNIDYINFTQNNINQINVATIKAEMKNKYWNNDEEPYLPLNFGFTDPITIFVGPTKNESIPLFGGYVLQSNPKNNELQIECIDRLMDLQRQQVYHNFSIGTVSSSDNVQQVNYISFPNVYLLSSYLATTAEHGMIMDPLNNDFGFYVNFAGTTDFDNITTTTWVQHRDPTFGMPRPCLKLTLGYVTGSAETIIYSNSSNPWNAYDYNMFAAHYYFSGISSRYPLEFDLKFTMYKNGETVASAQDYIVRFTGKGTQTNVIGEIKPLINGTFNDINFDLKAMFDKYVPSTEYNITKVSLVGTVNQDMLDNHKCSAVWLDNFHSYKTINKAPVFKSQNNVKSYFAELQDVADKTDHVAFTRPGRERCYDVLTVLPEETDISPVAIDETSNLISIENWKNDPKGQEFQNQSHITFNFTTDTTGTAVHQDEDSEIHFDIFETHKHEQDINNQNDADMLVQKNVINHKDANKIGFTVKILGTTLLEPTQYAAVSAPSHNISGSHKIATITHTIDLSKAPIYETKTDMNYPSNTFKRRLNKMNTQRDLLNIGLINAHHSYSQTGTRYLGNASPGAYGSGG